MRRLACVSLVWMLGRALLCMALWAAAACAHVHGQGLHTATSGTPLILGQVAHSGPDDLQDDNASLGTESEPESELESDDSDPAALSRVQLSVPPSVRQTRGATASSVGQRPGLKRALERPPRMA